MQKAQTMNANYVCAGQLEAIDHESYEEDIWASLAAAMQELEAAARRFVLE